MVDVLKYQYYKENEAEINKNNLTSLRMFALINIPISVLDIVYQAPFGIDLTTSILRAVYSIILWLLVHFLIKDSNRHATLLIYLAELPSIIGAIINGSFGDPIHVANSYMIFIILMPVMILDYPIRVIVYQASCSLVLIILSYIYKPEAELFIMDTVNVVRSLILAFALDLVVVRARIQEIDRARRALIEARKDPLTGLGNRTKYRRKMKMSMNTPIALVCFHVVSDRKSSPGDQRASYCCLLPACL